MFSRLRFSPLLLLVVALGCQTSSPGGAKKPQAEADLEPAKPGPAEPAPAQQGERYTDPQELYSLPVPRNWTIDKREGFTTLTDPDGQAHVHTSAVESMEVEEAISQAWQLLDDPPALEIDQVMRPPAAQGVDEFVVINYEIEDDHFAQAVGQRVEERVYVALIEGRLDVVQRRAAQLQTIATGLRPTALERVDLSEMEPLELTEEHLELLRDHVKEAMELLDVPGASIGIVQNQEVVLEEGFGIRDVEGDEEITASTRMMIGSTTKTMTTLLMASLVDEGVVHWDTPAQEILPQFSVQDPELSEQITLENLVCACTGVPRRDMEIIFNHQSLDAESVIDSLATFEFFTDFGEAFQYSNQMVAAGGYVAAAADGASYGQLYDGYVESMERRIFGPMELEHTVISFDEALATDDYALPHARGLDFGYERFDTEIERFAEPLAPAGAVWSNTRDMNRYLLTMLGSGVTPQGVRVVSEENLRHLWEPQVEITAEESYGLGWIISEYQGLKVLSHFGNTMGFTSEMAFAPETGAGITVLANGGGANTFAASVRTRLLELLYEQPTRAMEEVHFAREVTMERLSELRQELNEVDREAIEPFLGDYKSDALGELVLQFDGDRLILDAGEFRTEMLQKEDDDELILVIADPPMAGGEFTAEIVEDLATLRFGEGVMAYSFTRVDR